MSYDYPVAHYEALRTAEPIAIDGRLGEFIAAAAAKGPEARGRGFEGR